MSPLRRSESFPASIEAVETFCLSLRKDLANRLSKSELFATELVFREILANAVEHGSAFDVGRSVAVTFSVDADVLRAKISDTGPGYSGGDPANADRDPLRERGWGLEILQRYSRSYSWEDQGRTVVFEMTIGPPTRR